MRKIIVQPKDGKPAFYFSPLDRGRKSETVTTEKCFRCFGGMLLMKKREGAKAEYPQAGVYVWHILPGCKNYVTAITKYLFERIQFMSQSYEFETMFRCGGLIDTPQNEYRYDQMYKKIETQFLYLFPHVPILGDTPLPETLFMALRLEKDQFFRGDQLKVFQIPFYSYINYISFYMYESRSMQNLQILHRRISC